MMVRRNSIFTQTSFDSNPPLIAKYLSILSNVFVISSNVIDQFLYSFLYFSQSL